MHTKERVYPAECPACAQMKGYPKRVTTLKNDAHKLCISMCCHACEHEWDDVAELPNGEVAVVES